MSMHYIYVHCLSCDKVESVYIGNIDLEEFDESDWEGEYIDVLKCKECKEANHEQ